MKPLLIFTALFSFLSSLSLAQNAAPYCLGPKMRTASAGQTVCLSILTADDDPNDTVRLSWNTAVQTATFTHNNGTVKHASGEICWTPTNADTVGNPHLFFVHLDDGNEQVTDTFSIRVAGMPERFNYSYTVTNCGLVEVFFDVNVWTAQVAMHVRDSLGNPVLGMSNGTRKCQLYEGTFILYTTLQSNTPDFNTYSDTLIVKGGIIVKGEAFKQTAINTYLLRTDTKGNEPKSYKWFKKTGSNWDPLPDTTANITVQVWQYTEFKVDVSTQDNCVFSTEFITAPPVTGIEEIDKTAHIYPNPCEEVVTIESHNPMQSLTLFDIQGKQVLHQEETTILSTKLEVAALPQGTYLLAIRYADGSTGHHSVVVR